MALQTKTIKQNIKAVGNIKKMTKTMQMVSVSKMRKSTDLSKRGRLYAHHTQLLASRLAKRTGFKHKIFDEVTTAERDLYIVISSDKGLCGSYNSHIDSIFKQTASPHSDVIALGKQAIKIAERHKATVIDSYLKLHEAGDYDLAEKIAKQILDLFLSGKYQSVYVVMTHFVSTFEMHAQIRQILPFSKNMLAIPEEKQCTVPYTLEKAEDELMEFLIPELITEILYGFHKDAKASEHTARMIAMQQATDSAEKVQKDLIHDYNRARQSAVTQEITEITNAANAV